VLSVLWSGAGIAGGVVGDAGPQGCDHRAVLSHAGYRDVVGGALPVTRAVVAPAVPLRVTSPVAKSATGSLTRP